MSARAHERVTFQLAHGGLRHCGYVYIRADGKRAIIPSCGCPATGSGHKPIRNVKADDLLAGVTCKRGVAFRARVIGGPIL